MRIAVIGGGISGLTAAYLLAREHEVHLFEAAGRLGGHTYTVPVEEDGRRLWIDMGFIVHNDRTYPGFQRLLAQLGVPTEDTSMSFGVRCEATGLEYSGESLNGLFAQRRNLVRPRFYRMLGGMLRFHRCARQLLASQADEPTLGEFLHRHRLEGPVLEDYLLPMTAAIWSTDARRMLDFPAKTLATFLDRHGLLGIFDRPRWKVIPGGARRYVEAMTAAIGRWSEGGSLRVGTPVFSVRRPGRGGVEVRSRAGAEHFDHVIFSVHSDQALRLLGDSTSTERQVLRAVPYQDNEAVLHTDERFLPRRQRARASWNYHLQPGELSAGPGPDGESGDGPSSAKVRLTYFMNRLQNLEARRSYCVTLNRGEEIDPARVIHRTNFSHPLFTREAVAAQQRWAEVSRGSTSYCGAWWRYGFHEDGVWSAARVAAALGVTRPLGLEFDLPVRRRPAAREAA